MKLRDERNHYRDHRGTHQKEVSDGFKTSKFIKEATLLYNDNLNKLQKQIIEENYIVTNKLPPLQ